MKRLGRPIYEPEQDFDLGEEVLENFSVGKKDNKPKDNHPFLDFEDDELGKVPTRLPVIGIRTSAKSNLEMKKPEIPKKKEQPSYDFFEEDVDDQPIKLPEPKKPAEQPKDEYADDFEQDEYEQQFDDFEDEQQQPKKDNSPITKIISQTVKVTKETSRKFDRDSLSSRKGFKRPNSMSRNRISSSNNKYKDEIQASFPNIDLKSLDNEKLLRLNERIRNMIRRLNQQLNDILNKNAIALKLNQKSKTKNIEQKLQLLSQERKNNVKMIERMETEITKLRYREGEIRQDDYELEIHRRIDQMMELKKQMHKIVIRLKLQVDNQGKKLYEVHHRKDNEIYGSVKAQLVHLKKGEQTIIDNLNSLDIKISDMENNNREADEKLKTLVAEAEAHGIDLSGSSPLKEKYEKLKAKQENARKVVAASQGTFKVRADRIVQEIVLITRNIEHNDMQIRNLYSDIEHSMEESRKLIEKNRELHKNNPQFLVSLSNIEKSLVKPILTDFHEFKIKRTSRSASSMHRSRVIQKNKKESQQDILPLNPISLTKAITKEQIKIEDKPILRKDEQRVWKDPKQDADRMELPKQKQPDIKHKKVDEQILLPKPTEEKLPAEQKQPEPQDDSKPKFMLRRKANQDQPPKIEEPPPQQPMVQEVPKIEPSTMTSNEQTNKPFSISRFKARKKQPQQLGIFDNLRKQSEDGKNEFMSVGRKEADEEAKRQAISVQLQIKEEVVAPRRFMMRKKDQEDTNNDGYNSSIGRTDAPKQNTKVSEMSSNPTNLVNNEYKIGQNNNPTNNPPSNPTINPNPTTNPYAPTNNPYAPSNNPYAPKPERQGRLKKAKIQIPKEKFSIFDAKEVEQVNEFITNPRRQQPKEEVDMNSILGINKPRLIDPEDELLFGNQNRKPQRNRLQMPY